MQRINTNIDSWPELTYRYVEHYFWEPQHILKTQRSVDAAIKRGEKKVDAFYRFIRSQEVPLNYLLNVFFRIIPKAMTYACLNAFGDFSKDHNLETLTLKNGQDEPFTQPDIHLESDKIRVFIELKVDATISLEQVQKYILLQAHRDNIDRQKKIPYVLFLQKHRISEHWLPKTDRSLINEQGISAFLHQKLPNTGFSARLAKHKAVPDLIEPYKILLNKVTFGTSTWQELGDVIALEMEKRRSENGELGEMIENIADDFLNDLERRELWQSK